MDQEGPRSVYNEQFYEFIEPIVLNDQFWAQLGEHPCAYLLPNVQRFADNPTAQKCRIFGEFTMVRDNANQLATALEQSGLPANHTAGQQLRQFNLSEVAWPYSEEIELTVTPARALRSHTSKQLDMASNPRGVAIIIVTEPDLYLEADRFGSIFQQLLFTPAIHRGLTRDQIVNVLAAVANSREKYKADAFIMMFIGHGVNESIIGCSAQPPAPSDELPIRDIVAMFSDRNSRALRQKTKLVVFNCCREKEAQAAKVKPGAIAVNVANNKCVNCRGRLVCTKCETSLIDTLTFLDSTWKNENKQTHVIYACAEANVARPGKRPIGHVSVLGQALSHTIAQYSWYKNVYQLFVMTVDRIEKEYGIEHRPEINMFAVNKELYFNPGQYRADDDVYFY
ncbi:unnamed protein product [Medioppia subpectinata]|uniref:Caspase family p20 domain-containing protein n=1 Tax=Medioppia subpectinata TaxID=1979941 RepID=A0A7R9Q820_9ACAR|nr:unnamed protein product [Medioppia subpectinata]CAG2116333.1 unnamed protein product [Medioppia subpectinata]